VGRVVAIVDDRDARRELHDFTAVRCRLQSRARSASAASGTPQSPATVTAASTFARFARPTSGTSRSTTPCVFPLARPCPRCRGPPRPLRGHPPPFDAEGQHTTSKFRRAGDDPSSSAFATRRGRTRRRLRRSPTSPAQSRQPTRKNPTCASPTFRPDANIRLRNADQRADFTGVVHAELNDGHLRPMSQAISDSGNPM